MTSLTRPDLSLQLAGVLRNSIIVGAEDSEASDAEVKALKGELAKPIKFYFLSYGLRNGRMVLDKKLYASTVNYDIMYGRFPHVYTYALDVADETSFVLISIYPC